MKFRHLCLIVLLVAAVFSGCGEKDYDRMLEEHDAMSMQAEGVWEKRYEKIRTDPSVDAITATISINVKKDMTEDDMLEIIDYLDLKYNVDFDESGAYKGKKKDGQFICYAVFYRENTDEEMKKIKYVNGASVEFTKEEESYFASPELRTEDVEDGM